MSDRPDLPFPPSLEALGPAEIYRKTAKPRAASLESPTGMLANKLVVDMMKDLAVGESLTVEKITERKVRITRG